MDTFIKTITDYEKGVTCRQSVNHNIYAHKCWKLGKNGDKSAAEIIVALLWGDDQSKEMEQKVANCDNLVWLSVPTTSGKNTIPYVLSLKLAKIFGGHVIAGEELFTSDSTRQIKFIHKEERIFETKQYIPQKKIIIFYEINK